MNLTDNDKREIINLIQDNKPLPEKYRFLIFKDREEIELLWNGKSNEVSDIVLPFQTIEHVDEPREEKTISLQGNLFDDSGRQLRGWTNKLIWGNNNLILSSLLHGPMNDEIQKQGGLKLVYIDPPFNVGDDFHLDIKIGKNEFEKKRNILEEIAYRDTWGKGADSFLSMIYERIKLIYNLMSQDGVIYVHCDRRVNHLIKLTLIEIFGKNNFISEIQFQRSPGHHVSDKIDNITDTILFFSKSENYTFNPQYEKLSEQEINEKFPFTEKETGRRFTHEKLEQSSNKSSREEVRIINGKKMTTNLGWRWSQKTFDERIKENPHIIFWTENNKPRYKRYVDTYEGRKINNLWNNIKLLSSNSKEHLGYPTQKPEDLLKRIILQSSNENDLVADFFCGSGTTLAVAEKLNRKWIGVDLGKFAIHTSKKRLLNIQRKLKMDGKNYRAFEILNLGKYQRESFISKDSNNLNKNRENYYIDLILNAYLAEKINNPILHGIKNNRYVYVGPINIHISRKAVETVVNECIEKKITKVDVLCFDHEQGLFPNIMNEAKEKGVDVACKIIPPDVFDKKAIEKKQVVFHGVAFIEFKPIFKKKKLSIQLTGFSVDYSQEKIDEILSELKPGKSKVILNSGQIIKVSRDKNGIEKKEILTKSWKDWIDYWAVDFNFENKKEVFTEKDNNGNIIEKWTGDYIFENEWQSFRSEEKNLEFISAEKEIHNKTTKVAVKVIDIFGNDTMKVLKVNL